MEDNKSNDGPRINVKSKAKTMHRHCEKLKKLAHSPLVNHSDTSYNFHFNSIRTVCLVALLLLPAIVKCDKTILNEIDNGGDVQKSTLTELPGGRVIGEKWLRQMESPYSLQTDLTIERSGKLFIEPGVTVHVAPMVGITVRGVLAALVSNNSSNLIRLLINPTDRQQLTLRSSQKTHNFKE